MVAYFGYHGVRGDRGIEEWFRLSGQLGSLEKRQLLNAQRIATLDKRVGLLPDVPTLAESGIKDAEAIVWFGMAAPAKTPRALIDKLNRESNRVLGLPDVKKRFDELGLEIQGGTPEEFQKFIRNEVERLNRLINMGALTRE